MDYEQHINDIIQILFVVGVVFSFIQLVVTIKCQEYWAPSATIIFSLTIAVSCIVAGKDFAIYAAYEVIRGHGYFYADMFIDGVDSTKSSNIMDVVELGSNTLLITMGLLWTVFSLLGASVGSALVSSLFALGRGVEKFDRVFATVLPFMIMFFGSVLLATKKDFNEGALSNQHKFHQLDISISKEKLEALDAACPSDVAIYHRYKLSCDNEIIVSKSNPFFAIPYVVVVVWSDDLKEQKVILRTVGSDMSFMPKMSKVVIDTKEMINRLNSSLVKSIKSKTEDSTKAQDWGELELLPDR